MKIAFVYLNGEANIGRGAGYVASVIIQAGYELDFFDTYYTSLDKVTKQLCESYYDIVMISASTLFFNDAVELSTHIKRSTNSITLLGGAHATIEQKTILVNYDCFDFLCIGEGEGFVVEFLDKLSKGESVYSISNLCYQLNGEIIQNEIRPATDLNELPDFKYDLFPLKSIVLNSPKPGFCYVTATRGCPYNCTYCCNSIYLDMYKKSFLRTRNIDSIIKELLTLKSQYPINIFYFGDEMILFDKEYVSELFERVHKEVGVSYGCMARVEAIDDTIVDLFKRTGCKYVGMGIECGDEKYRREVLKRYMSNAQIIEAFKKLRTIPDIMLTSYNMVGYPSILDDLLTESTIQLNEIIKPDIVQMSLFFPFVGTELSRLCYDYDWIDYNKLNTVTDYFTQSVLREDLVGMNQSKYRQIVANAHERCRRR